MSLWSFSFGFTLDGIFIFGLTLLAKASFTRGAVLAAGFVMALRYLSEMLLSPASGRLAERVGPLPLLFGLSLTLSGVLTVLGTSGFVLWTAVLAAVLIRALIQPLQAPVLAELYPGPERVTAMARQAVWRDLGAGTGPMAAGVLFAAVPAFAIWAGAAAMLAAASLHLRAENGGRR